MPPAPCAMLPSLSRRLIILYRFLPTEGVGPYAPEAGKGEKKEDPNNPVNPV